MMGKKYQEESKGWDRNSRNTIRSKIKERYDRLKPMNTGGKTAQMERKKENNRRKDKILNGRISTLRKFKDRIRKEQDEGKQKRTSHNTKS